MALSFLKKVFTFGKDKPVEAEPATTPVADAVLDIAESAFTPKETRAIEAELEPHSRTEDLPVATDPVLAEEMDTAGGPSADTDDALEFETEAASSEDEDEAHAILPAAGEIGDIGLIPLSLLEAEAETEDSAVEESLAPSSVPSGHLPHKGGDQTAADATSPQQNAIDEVHEAAASPISPPVGEMSVQPTEGGKLSALSEAGNASEKAPPTISPLEGEMPDRAEGGDELSANADIEEAPAAPISAGSSACAWASPVPRRSSPARSPRSSPSASSTTRRCRTSKTY
jgi:fused signal recognition particle receptor